MRQLLILLFIVLGLGANGQQTVMHHCDFETNSQNMWGPSWSAFTINQEIDIFDFPWNVSGGTGNAGIVTILGQQFGAAASFGTSGVIGAKFSLEGFTTGHVNVDYPVDITLDMNTDSTYNQGEQVSIQTSYVVNDSFALETFYPSVGTAKLDMYFQFAANADLTLCAFGCTTIPIIPAFNTPTLTLNIFEVSAAGIYYLGPACAEAIPYYSANNGPGEIGEPSSGQNIFPFALPPHEDGCTAIPWQVHEEFLPLNLDDYCDVCGDYGIGGVLTIPYVETTDGLILADNSLYADGDSMYVELSLEIFKLIGSVLSETEIPYISTVGDVLANLSNEFTLPAPFGTIYGATLSYNIMSASFVMDITNKQHFKFTPKIYGKFEFPVAVQYQVMNGATVVSSGVSSIINCEIGHTIRYNFPCFYEHMDIKPTYTIIGNLRNHTYDSVGFRFDFSALQFGFNLPPIQITPAIYVPEICIPIPYPCPTWSNPFRWCTTTVCTPSFTIPAVGFSGFSFNIGPLIDEQIPLGDFQYDWYDNTWALEGFSPVIHPTFRMKARVFAATETHTDVACFGQATGSVDVSLVNGTAPFSYLWSNGANTQDLSGLVANGYFVTVTDANGCQAVTGATILQTDSPLSLSNTYVDKSCNGGANDGSIDLLTQGGTAPYSYLWTGGAITEDITNLGTGVYSVTVTDLKGCTAILSQTISEPSPLVQVGIVTDVNCFGGTDGAISTTASGGSFPYTYSWSNTAISNNISGVTAGSYTLTVTDIKGCISVGNYNVNQPLSLPSATLTFGAVSCHGGSDGSIDVTPAGGTPAYNYNWSNAGNQLMSNNTQDLTNVSAGTYTITITDTKGCTGTGSITVTEPAAPLSVTATQIDINCIGQATGSINTVVAGGTTPYNYLWSNGGNTPGITGLLAGPHSLTVTDGNGCTISKSYTLTEPTAPLSVALAAVDVACFGDASGSVSSTVAGGTTPYTYSWNTGASTAHITGLVAGPYTLNITDAKGCLANANIAVNQPLSPLGISNVPVSVDCFGNSTGSVDVTTLGGTAPYTFQWWDSTNQVMVQTTEDLSAVPAKTYYVHVTDSKGCVIYDTVQITQPSAALSISSVIDDVNCFAGSDGALDVTVVGGTTPYSYSWVSGQTTEDLSSIAAGTYSINVTDFRGCTLSSSFDVTQPTSPLVTAITTDEVLCFGQSTGSAHSTTTGGTAPYTYAWSNGTAFSFIEQVPAGPYSLTVTDSKGCFTFTGAVINQPSMPLTVVPTVTDASCYNYSDGSIVLGITGGTQPYYFSWANNQEIIFNNPSETLDGLVASNYLVRVRDKNGCTWEQVVTVGQPAPFVTQIVSTDALCYGSADGTSDLSVTGGTLPYTYLWSDGSLSEDVAGQLAGVYTVTITDAQGCVVRDTTTIGQPNEILIYGSITDLSCINQSDASIEVSVQGGVYPYTYNWSTGATSEDIADLIAGNYTLIVTDFQGCTRTETFMISTVNNDCVNPVNTFTPNGDNYNDTWIIENLYLYPNATVEVFNKWGNLVHSQTGVYVPWDGTHLGNELPSDVYYYIIDLYNDQQNKYTGSITIIR